MLNEKELIEMGKDPAVLFYTSDFLTGTMAMSNEQVGKYIRLLCLQHHKDFLSEKEMLRICGEYDEEIFAKFIKTEQGFYNERMRAEKERRVLFSKSRSENRSRRKEVFNKSISYDKDMSNTSTSHDNHMETVNETVTVTSFYKEFLEIFNKTTNRSFRGDSKSKRAFEARIKEGYQLVDFELATKAAVSDSKWMQGYKDYLTPEYICRDSKLQLWLNKAKHGNKQNNIQELAELIRQGGDSIIRK